MVNYNPYGCFQKYPKMDGFFFGKTLLELMIWGGFHPQFTLFSECIHIRWVVCSSPNKKTLWFFVTQQKPYGFLVIPHSPIFFYQSQAANTKSNCPNWASQTACFATRILEAAQWQLAIKGGFSGETWML